MQQSPVLFLLFLDLFAGEVFNGDLVKLHGLDVQRNFLFHLFLAGVILHAKLPHAGLGSSGIILNPWNRTIQLDKTLIRIIKGA